MLVPGVFRKPKESCVLYFVFSRFLSLFIALTEIHVLHFRLRSSSRIDFKRLELVPGSTLALYPGLSLVGFQNSFYLPIRRDYYLREWNLARSSCLFYLSSSLSSFGVRCA
jgi:hypothetical protein